MDQTNLFRAAELAYEVLQEQGRSAPSPEAIHGKLIQLMRGLPVEDELMAMCLWSGRCLLVHKLDKSVRPSKPGYRVPDLLCVMEYQGRPLPLLVEVKSSSRRTRRFSRSYCDQLQRYADLLKLPLLVAFKSTEFVRPIWSLFHLPHMRTPAGNYRIHMPEIVKHDLSGVLMGNFHVQLWEGIAISMTITKDHVRSNDSFAGTIVDVHWETADGKRVDAPGLLHWLFMLTPDDVEIEESRDRIIQRFKKLSDEAAIGYWVMSEVIPMLAKESGQADWGKLMDEATFPFTLAQLRESAVLAIKSGLVRYVIDPVPHKMPPFLQATS